MRFRPTARTAAVAALCATVAGAAGIAGSSAASKAKKTHKTTNSAQTARPFGPRGNRPVHADEVVLNAAGTAYVKQSEDNGTVVSVAGELLVITEGTTALPYATVTLTIPTGATIDRNGATAALTDFVAGDHVHVSQSSDATAVFGGNQVPFGPGGHGDHGRHGGPGGPWQAGGPPSGP